MKGKVFIIGLGPGDPELITVKAVKALRSSDKILYTGSLLSNELIRYVKSFKPDAVNTYGLSEEEIAEELIKCVEEGLTCSWVHDGDPAIYGGAAGIIKELRRRGIDYEIIPGVSSITAAADRLGIPLTAQGLAGGVLITNPKHLRRVKELPKETSLVILLAGGRINEVVKELIRLGASLNDPAAIISKCFWGEGEVVKVVSVGDLARYSEDLGVKECTTIIYSPTLRIDEAEVPRSKVYGGVRH